MSLSPEYVCLEIFFTVPGLCTLAHYRVAHAQLVWIGSTCFYNAFPESRTRRHLHSLGGQIMADVHSENLQGEAWPFDKGYLLKGHQASSTSTGNHIPLNPTARSVGQLPTLASWESGSPALSCVWVLLAPSHWSECHGRRQALGRNCVYFLTLHTRLGPANSAVTNSSHNYPAYSDMC